MRYTTKPDGWTDKDWADYRACEEDARDIMSQMQDRENAYERGDISQEEYENWEYDYSPLPGRDGETAAEADDAQGDSADDMVKAFGLQYWPVRYGLRVASSEDGHWVVWGHAEERRVVAAVAADARADAVLDYLLDNGGLAGVLAGITRRWGNNPREEGDDIRWNYCSPDAPGAVAVTVVEPASVSNPPATLADLFAARALNPAANALHASLVDHARRHSGESGAWLSGYSEGVEHVLEMLRAPGALAARFLSLLPFARPRPETVVLCGSMRFFPQMLQVAAELTDAGVVVLAPFRVVASADQSSAAKTRLDALHRRKIDMSHRVVVVTDESGYYGESTCAEITYAIRIGKPITWVTRPAASESA